MIPQLCQQVSHSLFDRLSSRDVLDSTHALKSALMYLGFILKSCPVCRRHLCPHSRHFSTLCLPASRAQQGLLAARNRDADGFAGQQLEALGVDLPFGAALRLSGGAAETANGLLLCWERRRPGGLHFDAGAFACQDLAARSLNRKLIGSRDFRKWRSWLKIIDVVGV